MAKKKIEESVLVEDISNLPENEIKPETVTTEEYLILTFLFRKFNKKMINTIIFKIKSFYFSI